VADIRLSHVAAGMRKRRGGKKKKEDEKKPLADRADR
jgi:hypothetical protein